MRAAQKCESPAATGLNATNQKTPAEFTPDQKRLATVTAQLSLAGHQVHLLEHGFLVCRWGQTKVCHDLAELVGFARQIGVQQ